MGQSVEEILARGSISASAPCRVDAGGTWDIKALTLPVEWIEPVTVNIALNLRTGVSLEPHRAGRVRIASKGFAREEDHAFEGLPFGPPYGLFFAAVSHFGFHGLRIRIQSDAPVKASLGGSSTALMALIKALSRLAGALGRPELSSRETLHLGYHLDFTKIKI